MDARKELILNTIVKEHIKTGIPVGSGILVDKYKINASPATVRNEMAALEEEGYIIQPHTSAGRVPTEKAYRHYLAEINDKKIPESDEKLLTEALKTLDETAFKQTAKLMASRMDLAVFWAFHRHNLYYTGISNLLQQPEFAQTGLIFDVSALIDRVDDIINESFDKLKDEVAIYLGEENPFAGFCSSIMFKYKLGDDTGLVGTIGPMRMNYEKNLAMMKFVEDKLRRSKD